MGFILRDVEDSDLELVIQMNEIAVPAVSRIDIVQMRWFATHAAYFRVATREDVVGAFMIGMRPGTSYTSPNYRWFCDAYDEFGYVDRIVVTGVARRQGLATLIYRDFEATLPAGVTVLTCEVNIEPPNESSMRFHEQLGFERVGSQETDGGAKEVALLAKELCT